MIKEITCGSCGYYTEWKNIKDYSSSSTNVSCPNCGSLSKNIVYRIHQSTKDRGEHCRVDELMRDRPRYSDALGINPDQRGHFAKKFPWMEFDKEDGRCLIRNRHDKIKHMKARGFAELD